MITRPLGKMALAIALIAASWLVQAHAAVPEYTAEIVKTYPHDPNAFTEGLLFRNGFLYESTGRNGQSAIREVNLRTGQVVREKALDSQYFGEGIVVWKNSLIQLTWRNEIGFVYDLKTFEPRSNFHYSGQGWALTTDGSRLIMSDGTTDLRILDPNTLNESGRIHVTCEGRTIGNINELEWVKGEVYANVWRTNVIVRINPTSGEIAGLIDLTDIAPPIAQPPENVPNGIAYDAAANRLFVTGKLWPNLYQIRLSRRSAGKNLCQFLPGARS
jgi:glutaminyl-peptide cyclotransferase